MATLPDREVRVISATRIEVRTRTSAGYAYRSYEIAPIAGVGVLRDLWMSIEDARKLTNFLNFSQPTPGEPA